MRASLLLTGLAAVLAMSPIATASAQEAPTGVSPEGADEIRRAIKDWIAERIQAGDAADAIDFQGTVTVVPEGDAYRVTLPPMAPQGPDAPPIVIPATDVTLRPLAGGWYEASWSLPANLDLSSEAEGTFRLGSISGTGVFVPEWLGASDSADLMTGLLNGIASLDLTISDVAAEPPGEAATAMQSIHVTAGSEEVSAGAFDTRFGIAVDGLSVDDPLSGTFDLGAFRFDIGVDGMRVLDVIAFVDRVTQLQQQMEAAGAMADPNAGLAELQTLLAETPRLLDGFAVSMALEGVEFDQLDGAGSFESFNWGFSLEGLDQPAMSAGIQLGLEGLDVQATEVPPEATPLIPNSFNLDLTFADVPTEAVTGAMQNFLQGAGDMGPQFALMMAGMGMMEAVASAGSRIEIADLRLASDVASVELDGVLRPDTASPFGLTSEATLVVTNMDDLVAQAALVPDSEPLVQGLTALQLAGEQGTDAAGNDIRTYAFEMTAEGDIRLNGADATPLFDSFAP